jgi:ribokinase
MSAAGRRRALYRGPPPKARPRRPATRSARSPPGTRYRAAMTKRPRVTVLGSLNMDISVTVPALPGPGATVLGSAARFTPGGKGANQAVAAARLGADVRMVGCVGDDDFGRQLVANLRAEGIDTSAVRVTKAPTGLAMIAVEESQSAENIIIVAPGANHEVGPVEVKAALTTDHDILVISAEIPAPAITQALADQRVKILNLAPAPQDARALAAQVTDWLVVNESEAAAVLGRPVDGLPDAARAAKELTQSGPRHAVVTAGAHGAALAEANEANEANEAAEAAEANEASETQAIEGFPVRAVDTVGAGDTFVGALAVALAAGVQPREAVNAAAAAGAAAVTRPGAQAAMPRPADILAATGAAWPVA